MRGGAGVLLLLALGACSFQVNDLSPYSSERRQRGAYGAPAVGRFLCLSVDPGLPVTLHPGGGPAIGYTRDVVAFYGLQERQYISIVYYNGALGWIDGMKIRRYHGSRPTSSCVIPGVDIQQRPISLIQKLSCPAFRRLPCCRRVQSRGRLLRRLVKVHAPGPLRLDRGDAV